MDKRCFGIDVGGTTVKMGLFDGEGNLLRKWEIPTRKEDAGKNILPDIAESILAVMKEEGIGREDLCGIGIGVPGPVLARGTVERCVNLGWETETDLVGSLRALLGGVKVRAANDANIAALGEVARGSGRGVDSAVMVTLGTGVGGGLILGGKIVPGVHGMGGEIGHMHVRDEDEDTCNCGGKGCVEQTCSATGLVREARRILAADPGTHSVLREKGPGFEAKDVMIAAMNGDELADRAVETFARYLGRSLANVAMVVDPEVFIIGGGVSRAGDFLISRIDRYYRMYSPLSKKKSAIVAAALGNDAGIYGAARMILVN